MAESRISKECMDAAKEALSALTAEDLETYVSMVMNRARSYEDVKGAAAVNKAIEEVGQEDIANYTESLQIKVNDLAKSDQLSAEIKDSKIRVLDILAKRDVKKGLNVEASERASRKQLLDVSINQLKPEELKHLLNRNNEERIFRMMDGEDVKDSTPLDKVIVDMLNRYYDHRNVETVLSNALPLRAINKDRFFPSTHDPSKILRGGRNTFSNMFGKKSQKIEQSRSVWKETIKRFVNLKKTFEESEIIDLDGNIDKNKLEDALDEIYNNIMTGKMNLYSIGQGKKEMFFYWNSMNDWGKYNKIYGKGTLYEALYSDIMSSSRKIGLANVLGSNPLQAYTQLAKAENKFNPQSSSVQKRTKVQFDYINGALSTQTMPLFSALRALSSVSSLAGRMTLMAITDLPNTLSYAYRVGYLPHRALGAQLQNLFNLIPTEERKLFASMFKDSVNSHMLHVGRYVDQSDIGGLMNKFSNLAYRATLMTSWDAGQKMAAFQIQADLLGRNAKIAFEKLSPELKKYLNQFDISDKEWDVIRHKTTSLKGKDLFTLDNVKNLSNEEIRSIYGVDEKTPLYTLKNQLFTKVYSLFDTAAEHSVLSPSSFMKAQTSSWVKGADNIHPILGEITKSIMQFKQYTLSYMDRVLRQGFQDADGVKNKIKMAALLLSSTTMLSYLSMNLDYISRGKTVPDWDKMTYGERIAFSKNLLIPSWGFASNFIDPNYQSADKVSTFFQSPSLQAMYSALIIPAALAEESFNGDLFNKKFRDTRTGKAFKTLGKKLTPGMGVPFLSPYLHEAYGDKTYLLHGQKQEFGS